MKMDWLKNLKVKSKLLLSFLIILMLAIGTGVFTLANMESISGSYASAMDISGKRLELIFEAKAHFEQSRFLLREVFYPDKTKEDLVTLSDRMGSELDGFSNNLESLKIVAAPAVREKIGVILPLIETYRSDLNEVVGYLLAVDDVSIHNPLYIDALLIAKEKISEMVTSYVGDMIAMMDDMPNMAINVLHNLAADNEEKSNTAIYISIGILAITVICSVAIALVIAGFICKPLSLLSAFMRKAGSTGDLTLKPEDIDVIAKYSQYKDEIGQTISGSASFIQHVTIIAEELESIAGGDLTVEIKPISSSDTMGISILKMVDSLSDMFGEVQVTTEQVTGGARQVADGAQALAHGTSEQAESIQQLSSTIADIASKTKENAATAERTSQLSEAIKESAEKGTRQMDEMMMAVKEINDASQSISKIIKTIDDIAFQTNILALNAAVEAARAGRHGTGFAVVAQEVRNLAVKSAEAAKETGDIVQNSMDKAEFGSCIAGETATSLSEIVTGINESSHLIAEIARASEEQSMGITKINTGIDKVAYVVQQNSATAQESAAASQQMSSQSTMLHELISYFRIKRRNAMYPELQST